MQWSVEDASPSPRRPCSGRQRRCPPALPARAPTAMSRPASTPGGTARSMSVTARCCNANWCATPRWRRPATTRSAGSSACRDQRDRRSCPTCRDAARRWTRTTITSSSRWAAPAENLIQAALAHGLQGRGELRRPRDAVRVSLEPTQASRIALVPGHPAAPMHARRLRRQAAVPRRTGAAAAGRQRQGRRSCCC